MESRTFQGLRPPPQGGVVWQNNYMKGHMVSRELITKNRWSIEEGTGCLVSRQERMGKKIEKTKEGKSLGGNTRSSIK